VQCSACRQVHYYCGNQCQGVHWAAAHKGQCRQFLSAVAAKYKDLGGKGLQQESPSSKRTSPPQPAPEKARPDDRMQELASQPRKVLEQPDDGRGGGFE
jgi:hypothetical protein